MAETLKQRRDTSVDPCTHFYDYACGNWIKDAIIPHGHSKVDTLYSDIDRQRNLRGLLEDAAGQPEAIAKAQTLYDSCMDRATRELNGVNSLTGGVELAFGGWPVLEDRFGGKFNSSLFDITTLMTGLFVGAGSTSIIRAGVKYHDRSRRYQLEIFAGKFSPMPNVEYLVGSQYSRERDALLYYMTNFAIILGADPEFANAEMADVLELETKLARAYLSSQRNPDHVVTVREMQNLYPDINWTAFLTALIPATVANVNDNFELVNVDGEYLHKALDILRGEPARVLANWMIWLCDNDVALYFNDAVRTAYYDFIAFVEHTPDREYYQDCVDLVQTRLPSATTRLYADAYISDEESSLIDTIAEDMERIVIDLIDRSRSYRDEDEAKDAVRHAVISAVVPDHVLDNYQLDREYENLNYPGNDVFLNFLTTLAWQIQQNVALLRAGNSQTDIQRLTGASLDITLTRPPVFHKDWPWYLNYGTLGARIASELILATNPAENIYNTERSCLEDQYTRFSLPENGRTPLGDEAHIIADNAGLQVATQYFAAQTYRSKVTLTGIDLTAEQLFFLVNAQQWCEKYSYDYASQLTGQTPGRFRVDGLLQNSAAFSDAFKCSATDRMNPPDKCVVL